MERNRRKMLTREKTRLPFLSLRPFEKGWIQCSVERKIQDSIMWKKARLVCSQVPSLRSEEVSSCLVCWQCQFSLRADAMYSSFVLILFSWTEGEAFCMICPTRTRIEKTRMGDGAFWFCWFWLFWLVVLAFSTIYLTHKFSDVGVNHGNFWSGSSRSMKLLWATCASGDAWLWIQLPAVLVRLYQVLTCCCGNGLLWQCRVTI